jgi:hypothetical protein
MNNESGLERVSFSLGNEWKFSLPGVKELDLMNGVRQFILLTGDQRPKRLK